MEKDVPCFLIRKNLFINQGEGQLHQTDDGI
jgi:hypothetical protein